MARPTKRRRICALPRTSEFIPTGAADGAAVEVTQKEYDLLVCLLSEPGKVWSREELMEKVWGYEYYGDLRTVDVAMRRLREKLEEDPANPKYFITKRGAGYYLQK